MIFSWKKETASEPNFTSQKMFRNRCDILTVSTPQPEKKTFLEI
jgi:hypothetical protein